MRIRQPVERLEWRRRNRDDVLPSIPRPYGGELKGEDRCRAIALERGDCPFERWPNSSYCYYHHKLFIGLTEPSAPVYPVWPLPCEGYVITTPEEVAA